jgi:hypothetical protein
VVIFFRAPGGRGIYKKPLEPAQRPTNPYMGWAIPPTVPTDPAGHTKAGGVPTDPTAHLVTRLGTEGLSRRRRRPRRRGGPHDPPACAVPPLPTRGAREPPATPSPSSGRGSRMDRRRRRREEKSADAPAQHVKRRECEMNNDGLYW